VAITRKTFVLAAVLCGTIAVAVIHRPSKPRAEWEVQQEAERFRAPTAAAALATVHAPDGFTRAASCSSRRSDTVCFLRVPSVVLHKPQFQAWIVQSGFTPSELQCLPDNRFFPTPHLRLSACVGLGTRGPTAFLVHASSLVLAHGHARTATNRGYRGLRGTTLEMIDLGTPRHPS
jgi:hypothetical protein